MELPLIYRGIARKTRHKLAVESLTMVGLEKRMHHKPNEMSGGQQQRVAIARAIAARPPVILADEATVSVDPENEHLIQAAISELTKGKTLITIAHRLATIENADQILVVDNGRIAQRGRMEESKCSA